MPDRIRFVARQAAAWVSSARSGPPTVAVALILSNYPDRDGRIANGVGLDTPESTVRVAYAMAEVGYTLPGFPETGAALMARLLGGPTNAINLPLRGRSKSRSDFGRG